MAMQAWQRRNIMIGFVAVAALAVGLFPRISADQPPSRPATVATTVTIDSNIRETLARAPQDARLRAADRARALVAITSAIELLDYTEQTAACHARLIAHARRAGTPRGAHDLIIVAHAVQTERTVLTFDPKARFADLPGVSATEP
jgi:predicted nucleic acid-binding protein